jgi:hypothetical protein
MLFEWIHMLLLMVKILSYVSKPHVTIHCRHIKGDMSYKHTMYVKGDSMSHVYFDLELFVCDFFFVERRKHVNNLSGENFRGMGR